MKLITKNLLKYGYFPEVLPQDLFNTKLLLKNYSFVKNKKENENSTPLMLISSSKNDTERRFLGLPHIETYIDLCKKIELNKEKILFKINNNENSQSKKIAPFNHSKYYSKSDFNKNKLEKIRYSMGYKYLLYIDISQFYENIYTHSITWALLGKKKAKAEYNKKTKEQSEEYKEADNLDIKLRAINNKETKGIPTGPLSSRVISELILAEVDSILRKEGFIFKRFVDDFSFYFRSKEEAQISINKIQKILYEFKLHINHQKLKIEKYPYSLSKNLKVELKETYKKGEYINFLENINVLFSNGAKGAYKYALKMISRDIIPTNEIEEVVSMLLNIMLINPKLSYLVIKILNKNKVNINFIKNYKKTLNLLIMDNIKLNNEEELIWLIYFAINFELKIEENNIIEILKSGLSFSIIIILDYIHLNKRFTENIKKEKEILRENLKKESIYGEKWLLLYEANFHDWIQGLKDHINKSKFLEKLHKNKINFYKSLDNK